MRTSFVSCFLLFWHLKLFAFQVPPLTGPVVDQVGLISRQAQQSLAEVIIQLNNKQKAQLQVLVIESLEGAPIEQASIQVVDSWKLGTQKGDNGVLLFISLKDKKIRIEVGQGLEGDLPDVVASRIIREVIAPYFKQQKFSEGVIAGVFAIIKTLDPEFNLSGESAQSLSPKRSKPDGTLLFVILFILFALFNRGSGRRIYRRGGPWGGGFGGGGFGGGGWGGSGGGWSGGGGGFSGGGASGDW